MTSDQFLKTFTQHLRVAEPERSSALAEIQHHLSELEPNQDPVQKLGDPKVLANAENRTYIGVLGSLRNLLILPWVVCLGFIAMFSGPGWLSKSGTMFSGGSGFWLVSILAGNLALIGFFWVSGWVGIALRRTHRTGMLLGGLAVMSVAAVMVILITGSYLAYLSDPTHQGFGAIFGFSDPEAFPVPETPLPFYWRETITWTSSTALIGTLIAAGTALGVGYFVKPFVGLKKKHPAWQAFLEAMAGVVALMAIWYLASGLVGIIASFFIHPNSSPSEIIKWLTSIGAYIVAGVFVVPIVGRQIWKRFRQYSQVI